MVLGLGIGRFGSRVDEPCWETSVIGQVLTYIAWSWYVKLVANWQQADQVCLMWVADSRADVLSQGSRRRTRMQRVAGRWWNDNRSNAMDTISTVRVSYELSR